ncbi:MAG: CidA/LrgA family protein [Deltaproteobacteria bacterium]|nr:CidA/LrgA family protein [Deltaproteobacteria bacterium]
MKLSRVLAQILALGVAFVAFDRAARALSSPIPGGVIGAVVLAVLLLTDVLPLRWVEDGADVLLANLGLFFVPAAVVALRTQLGWREIGLLALVSTVTTVLVLSVTGALASRWERR